MRRYWVIVAVALTACLLSAGPAQAAAPQVEQGTFSHVVEDLTGDRCGFPIRWEINGVYRDIIFTNDTGTPVRIVSRTEEENLVTNLDTGVTVVDRPRFNQKIELLPDGRWGQVTTTGIFAHAGSGRNQVKDVGRFVWAPWDGGRRTLLFAAGQHDLLEQSSTPDFQAWLGAFCHLVAPT